MCLIDSTWAVLYFVGVFSFCFPDLWTLTTAAETFLLLTVLNRLIFLQICPLQFLAPPSPPLQAVCAQVFSVDS